MDNYGTEEKHKSPRNFMEQNPYPIFLNENNTTLPIRSWTRLGLGIVLLGVDALMDRTRTWEQNVEQTTHPLSPEHSEYNSSQQITQEVVSGASPDYEPHPGRQAFVGLIFDVQDRLIRGFTTIHRLEGLANRLVSPVVSPVVNGKLFHPVKSRFDKLVSRGQKQVDYWVQMGMTEEAHSRELLKTATITTVDTSIDYLSSNPDVKELVQSQSTNLVNEIIEEVRERTVSADTLVEGIARAALHLTPRHNLPEPPLEVRMRAIRIRPPKIDKLVED